MFLWRSDPRHKIKYWMTALMSMPTIVAKKPIFLLARAADEVCARLFGWPFHPQIPKITSLVSFTVPSYRIWKHIDLYRHIVVFRHSRFKMYFPNPIWNFPIWKYLSNYALDLFRTKTRTIFYIIRYSLIYCCLNKYTYTFKRWMRFLLTKKKKKRNTKHYNRALQYFFFFLNGLFNIYKYLDCMN